jgi:hypothetical protein
MTTLLEFFLRYCNFLYLAPDNRITDSRTSGAAAIDAGLTVTGLVVSWSLDNSRGRIGLAVAPTQFASPPENWFRIPLVRQYLDGYDEMNAATPEETVAWTRDNIGRIQDLFSEASATTSCRELIALEERLAIKYFGPPKT